MTPYADVCGRGHGSKRTPLSRHTTAAVPDTAQESCLWLHLPLRCAKTAPSALSIVQQPLLLQPCHLYQKYNPDTGLLSPANHQPCQLALQPAAARTGQVQVAAGHTHDSTELWQLCYAAAGCLWQQPQLAEAALGLQAAATEASEGDQGHSDSPYRHT